MRQTITFFVSYAHDDNPHATTFLKRLTEQLRPSKRYEYTFWRDSDILVGERWHETILQALDACQLGLCLASPSFLASSYIYPARTTAFCGTQCYPGDPRHARRVWTGNDTI